MGLSDEVRDALRDVPDFPKEGIVFKDISPLLADAVLFERVTDWMVERFRAERPTHVLGIESRGFLFGAPVAHRMGAGFIPARKPGKLPWQHRAAGIRPRVRHGCPRDPRGRLRRGQPGADRRRPAGHRRHRRGGLRPGRQGGRGPSSASPS